MIDTAYCNLKFYNNTCAAAKKLCDCPGSEFGKVNLDVCAHRFDCWIRKRLVTKKYTTNTSVTPRIVNCGYSLGVALAS